MQKSIFYSIFFEINAIKNQAEFKRTPGYNSYYFVGIDWKACNQDKINCLQPIYNFIAQYFFFSISAFDNISSVFRN